MQIDELTLGEVEEVEAYSGMPLAAMTDMERPKTKLLIALAYVLKRKTDPKFTIEHAKKLTMNDLNEILGIGEDVEDPTKK